MIEDRPERIVTIPNALSFYRLCAAPVILYLVIIGAREPFAVMLVVSLGTDVADGLIARLFNQKTRLGARLDSFADEFTFLVAIIGLLTFEWPALRGDWVFLAIFLVSYVASSLVPYLRFGKLPAFHLYSFRATGYLLAANFILIFTLGYMRGFFLFALVFGTLACLEIVAVALALDTFRTDQRGLYWVLRNRKRSARNL